VGDDISMSVSSVGGERETLMSIMEYKELTNNSMLQSVDLLA
jgi:hypothetical protein